MAVAVWLRITNVTRQLASAVCALLSCSSSLPPPAAGAVAAGVSAATAKPAPRSQIAAQAAAPLILMRPSKRR